MERQTSDPGNIPLTFEERKAIALEKGFTEDQCFSTHSLDNLGIPEFRDKSQLLSEDDIRVNYYEDKIDILNRTYGELQQKTLELEKQIQNLIEELESLVDVKEIPKIIKAGIIQQINISRKFICSCKTELERWSCTEDCQHKPKVVKS